MSNWVRKLEIVTNFAIVIACCAVCVFVVRATMRRPTQVNPPSARASVLGETLKIPGVDWSKSDKTLVVAISTECHFCKESAPFYRALATKTAERHMRMVAVLPQTEGVSRRYLSDEQVAANSIVQLPLAQIGVEGTPTLFLTNSSGKVLDVWVGKLSPEREAEVLAKI